MLKIMGALLIVCGTAAWGIGSVFKMKSRVNAIKAITESMDMLKDEICINLTPVPEVMRLLGKSAPNGAAELYKSVYENMDELADIGFFGVWMRALDKSGFDNEERDVLIRLGAGLGKYDFESQGRVIANAKRKLERIEVKAEAERAVNSKLHAFLGVAAGMMAVVVLF